MDQRVKIRLAKQTQDTDFWVVVDELEKAKALIETVRFENARLGHELGNVNQRLLRAHK